MKKLSASIIIFFIGSFFGLIATLYLQERGKSDINQNKNFSALVEKKSELQKEQKVFAHLMVDFGDGKIITCNNQEVAGEKTVFDLLQQCSQKKEKSFELIYKEYQDLGVFITQIGSKISGKNSKFWQFWVNNKYSTMGASQYKLKSQDVVEWKYLLQQF